MNFLAPKPKIRQFKPKMGFREQCPAIRALQGVGSQGPQVYAKIQNAGLDPQIWPFIAFLGHYFWPQVWAKPIFF